jgi:hypothetical protein
VNVTKIGTGYAKELKINWQGTIPTTGMTISVSDDQNFGPVINQVNPGLQHPTMFSASSKSFTITLCNSASHEIRIAKVNGKTVKTIKGFGKTEYRFGGTWQQGMVGLGSGVYVVKVISGKDIISKRFVISR